MKNLFVIKNLNLCARDSFITYLSKFTLTICPLTCNELTIIKAINVKARYEKMSVKAQAKSTAMIKRVVYQ